MANRQIRMSPDALHMRASEIRTQGAHAEEVIAELDSIVKALSNEWEGISYEAFLATYEELRPGFQKAKDLIYEISEALEKTAIMFEERDNEIAAAFKEGSRSIPVPMPMLK